MKKLILAGIAALLVLPVSAHATEYCGVRVGVSQGMVPVYTEPNTRSFKMRLLPDGAMLDIMDTAVPYDEEEWTPIKDNGWVETKYTQAIECTRAPQLIPGATVTPQGVTTTFGPTMADAPSWLKYPAVKHKPRMRRR
jgi:hypothetical protein